MIYFLIMKETFGLNQYLDKRIETGKILEKDDFLKT